MAFERLRRILPKALIGLALATSPASAQNVFKTEVKKEQVINDFSYLLQGTKEHVVSKNVQSPSVMLQYKEMCDRIEKIVEWYRIFCEKVQIEKNPKYPIFNQKNLELIDKINREVNTNILEVADEVGEDVWNPGALQGDCEEFVFLKLIKLHQELKIPLHALRPNIAWYYRPDGKREGHMTLFVDLQTEINGRIVTIVLDSIAKNIFFPTNGKHLKFYNALSPSKRVWEEIEIKTYK